MCARVHCASGLRSKEYQRKLERLRVAASGRQPAGPPVSSELRFFEGAPRRSFSLKGPGSGLGFPLRRFFRVSQQARQVQVKGVESSEGWVGYPRQAVPPFS